MSRPQRARPRRSVARLTAVARSSPSRTRRRLIGVAVLLGCAWTNAAARAQKAPAAVTPRPIAESAERLARELWPVDVSSDVDELGRPRFRAGVTAAPFVLPWPWQQGGAGTASGPVNPNTRLYHREFLDLVTPEEFRGGTLNPVVGVSVDPGVMFQGVKGAWRDWQGRRARIRIEKEAAQLRQGAAAESEPDTSSSPP